MEKRKNRFVPPVAAAFWTLSGFALFLYFGYSLADYFDYESLEPEDQLKFFGAGALLAAVGFVGGANVAGYYARKAMREDNWFYNGMQ